MKKISVALVVSLLLALCLGCFPVSAEEPAVIAPAKYYVSPSTVKVTDPSTYDMFNGDICWSYNDGSCGIDGNNRAVIMSYNAAVTLSSVVACNANAGIRNHFTDIDSLEIWYSIDGKNWTKATIENVSIDDYTANGELYDRYTFALEAAVTGKHFMVYSTDSSDFNEWLNGYFVVRTNPAVFYGVGTMADPLAFRTVYIDNKTYAKTAEGISIDGTAISYNAVDPYFVWTNSGGVNRGAVIYYEAGVTANELLLGELGSNWYGKLKLTDFTDLNVWYTDDPTGAWTKIDAEISAHEGVYDQELSGSFGQVFRFVFDETVNAKYFLFTHDQAGNEQLGISSGSFTAVYDPASAKGDGESTAPETNTPETNAPETTEAPATEPETTVAPETDPVTTEAPATDPVTTEAPGTAETDDTKADAENDMTWLYIVIAVAVVAVVVIVIVVAKKKKK